MVIDWVDDWHKYFTKFWHFNNCSSVPFEVKISKFLAKKGHVTHLRGSYFDLAFLNFATILKLSFLKEKKILWKVVWFFVSLTSRILDYDYGRDLSTWSSRKFLLSFDIFAFVHRCLFSGQTINHVPCGVTYWQSFGLKSHIIWTSLRHTIWTCFFSNIPAIGLSFS